MFNFDVSADNIPDICHKLLGYKPGPKYNREAASFSMKFDLSCTQTAMPQSFPSFILVSFNSLLLSETMWSYPGKGSTGNSNCGISAGTFTGYRAGHWLLTVRQARNRK